MKVLKLNLGKLAATAATTTALLSVLAMTASGCKAKLGGSCDVDGRAVCQDKAQALVCVDKKWETLACRGAKGCAETDGRSACDEDLARDGEVCNRSGDTCGDDKKSLLHCEKNHWKLTEVCGGPKGCAISGATANCDSTQAKEGDVCMRAETHACGVDKHTHLACRGGKFVAVSKCRGPKACRFVADKIDCDDSLGMLGDPCSASAGSGATSYACSTDERSLLKCKDGKLVTDEACKTKEKCVIEEKGAGCK